MANGTYASDFNVCSLTRFDDVMMYCFIERALSKMKPRLLTVLENSTSVLLREIVCGCGKGVLVEDGGEKRMASVLSLFSLSLFSSIHSPISLTQS